MNNCTDSAQVTVSGTTGNISGTWTGTDTSVCGVADGTVTVTGSPDDGNLEYQLSGGSRQSTGFFSGLAAGSYTVNIRNTSNLWCNQGSVLVTVQDG